MIVYSFFSLISPATTSSTLAGSSLGASVEDTSSVKFPLRLYLQQERPVATTDWDSQQLMRASPLRPAGKRPLRILKILKLQITVSVTSGVKKNYNCWLQVFFLNRTYKFSAFGELVKTRATIITIIFLTLTSYYLLHLLLFSSLLTIILLLFYYYLHCLWQSCPQKPIKPAVNTWL